MKDLLTRINKAPVRKDEWIGIDLDGTLAQYDRWRGVNHIGKPVEPMLKFVHKLIALGWKVKIFTARASQRNDGDAITPIKEWCMKYFGQELEITNVKDFGMIALLDDRAIQVRKNSGEFVL